MDERFCRTAMLLGEEALDKLASVRVAIFGIGGVGGYIAEALARSGVGALDLIDSDVVSVSNVNRQIVALDSTVGKLKTEAARERIADINPNCKVRVHNVFFLPENASDFDFSKYDYVADAVDTVAAKIAIVRAAQDAGVKVISCMGAGNKLDPSAFEAADIFKTSVCPLAKVMRAECRKAGIKRLKVVYSKEPPVNPRFEVKDGVRRSTPGSAAFVPGAAGLLMAAEIVKDLITAE